MSEKEIKKFPEGFSWGAATSAFQVEGGIVGMDWEKAAQEGKVPKIGRAADHYNRYEEDFDIAKSLGHNAHRFSIEWARIEPREGEFNEAAIEHYREVLRALHARGLKPYITLWHFTLPLWFSERGGFERTDAPEIFARYCAYVVSKLHDLCQHFATINEPNVYATHGYLYGAWPPFKRVKILWKKIGKEDGTSERTGAHASFMNLFRYFKVTKHLAEGHNRAYDKIKAIAPEVKISVVKHVRYFFANGNPFNKILVRIATYYQTERFMNQVIKKSDEIGLNFYRSTKFGDTATYKYTDMGWKIVPEHIYGAIMILNKYKKPIFVSEAGVADEKDVYRADYIKKQVASTWQAIQDGADVRGHMYWSLLDNYELALGFEKRFGLVEVDFKTLERKIRPSAYIYKEICEQNGL
jgi:beta-glucosidase